MTQCVISGIYQLKYGKHSHRCGIYKNLFTYIEGVICPMLYNWVENSLCVWNGIL